MSSFFRKASDISGSGDTSSIEDSSVNCTTSKPAQSTRHIRGQSEHELVARHSPDPPLATQHHQNVLFHALLEDKCLNDVCHEFNASSRRQYTRDDPEVRARASERYRALTGQLATHGLASPGLEHDRFSHVRQTARDGLTLLSQQLDALDLSTDDHAVGNREQHLIRQPLRRLLTDYAASDDTHTLHRQDRDLSAHRNLSLASQLLPSHPLLDSTRYIRDFEEVSLLGKGGYGSVFHCNHRLDGRSYAVKKIILGPSTLVRVQKRGEEELDNILTELRTLARLEHPNIVRYFGGWVEWSKADDQASAVSKEQPRLITAGHSDIGISSSAVPKSGQHDDDSFRRDATTGASHSDGIVFDSSLSDPSQDNKVIPGSSYPSTGLNEIRRTQTRSTIATVSDEDVEVIPRNEDQEDSSISKTNPTPIKNVGPCLTLNIQMSLYPLTLAQYLNSTDLHVDGSQLTLQHCFHLDASIRIMLAILDGVQHLHYNGIIHRDLKPANIFLSPTFSANAHAPHGSIDPLSCRQCNLNEPRLPEAGPQGRQLRMSVCVGDFGLVSTLRPATESADLRHETTPLAENRATHAPHPRTRTDDNKQVGTQLYRPTTSLPSPHESMDIFALAIILVELLTRFGTRMERYETLTDVRAGRIPSTLASGDMQRAMQIVDDMLAAPRRWSESNGDVLGCADVKERLTALLDGT